MKKSLDERLKNYPELRESFEAMLEIAENNEGDLIKADDAEERVLEEMQRTGKQALTGWAKTREAKLAQQLDHNSAITRNGKKT